VLNFSFSDIDDMDLEEIERWHEEAARLWKLRCGEP
jgi:hypothetical protein